MKRITLAISLLSCLGATVSSQEQRPRLLLRAAQCLQAKNFLPPEATRLTFGYVLDEESYRPDKVIYVVTYAGPTRSDGLVYLVVFTEQHDHQAYDIQNNAGFFLSKGEPTWKRDADPLGGAWTQAHLASAIKHIEKQPRFTIPLKDLAPMDPSISCRAYTDPQKLTADR